MNELTTIITSSNPEIRNQSLDAFCRRANLQTLLNECKTLEHFRMNSNNLYQRVRALFFLYAINRFHLPLKINAQKKGLIPFEGYSHLLKRRFEEAIEIFLKEQSLNGATDAICSALATAYHSLGFQTLADGSEVYYQISTPYCPGVSRGLRWNDPSVTIEWPLPVTVMSDEDRQLPTLGDSEASQSD